MSLRLSQLTTQLLQLVDGAFLPQLRTLSIAQYDEHGALSHAERTAFCDAIAAACARLPKLTSLEISVFFDAFSSADTQLMTLPSVKQISICYDHWPRLDAPQLLSLRADWIGDGGVIIDLSHLLQTPKLQTLEIFHEVSSIAVDERALVHALQAQPTWQQLRVFESNCAVSSKLIRAMSCCTSLERLRCLCVRVDPEDWLFALEHWPALRELTIEVEFPPSPHSSVLAPLDAEQKSRALLPQQQHRIVIMPALTSLRIFVGTWSKFDGNFVAAATPGQAAEYHPVWSCLRAPLLHTLELEPDDATADELLFPADGDGGDV